MGQKKISNLHIVTDIKVSAAQMDSKIFRTVVDTNPDYNITACLINHVTNWKALLNLLIKGELPCALLNTTYLPDLFPVLVASAKAVHSLAGGTLKTKGVHTELLYNLSPSHSISAALKTFGISGKEESLLVVCLPKGVCGIEQILAKVEGDVVDVGGLCTLVDVDKMRTLYGITEEELDIGSLSDAVVLRVAVKGA